MHELIIEPGRAEKNYWRDLWRYRELFYILAWRDISVRYKQTVIGVAWALIQPLLTMLIMTAIFGKVGKLPSGGNESYSIMVFASMLPWMFFECGPLRHSAWGPALGCSGETPWPSGQNVAPQRAHGRRPQPGD